MYHHICLALSEPAISSGPSAPARPSPYDDENIICYSTSSALLASSSYLASIFPGPALRESVSAFSTQYSRISRTQDIGYH